MHVPVCRDARRRWIKSVQCFSVFSPQHRIQYRSLPSVRRVSHVGGGVRTGRTLRHQLRSPPHFSASRIKTRSPFLSLEHLGDLLLNPFLALATSSLRTTSAWSRISSMVPTSQQPSSSASSASGVLVDTPPDISPSREIPTTFKGELVIMYSPPSCRD